MEPGGDELVVLANNDFDPTPVPREVRASKLASTRVNKGAKHTRSHAAMEGYIATYSIHF